MITNTVTVLTFKKPTGKKYTLKNSGASTAQIQSHATAEKFECKNVDDFSALLESISNKNNTALMLGQFIDHKEGEILNVVPSYEYKEIVEARGIKADTDTYNKPIKRTGHKNRSIARLSRTVLASDWFLIDVDVPEMMPKKLKKVLANGDIKETMANVHSCFTDASCVSAPSSSSRIKRIGSSDTASSNSHTFYKADYSSNVQRFGRSLLLHSMSTKYGFMRKVKSNGQTIGERPWSVFDPTTFSPERLIFTGQPTIKKSAKKTIQHVPYSTTVHHGTVDHVPTLDVQCDEYKDYKIEKSGKSKFSISDNKSLTDDTVIEAKIYGLEMTKTLAEYRELGIDKIRCQSPFRPDSKSYAAIMRFTDSTSLVYDVGTGINYYKTSSDAQTLALYEKAIGVCNTKTKTKTKTKTQLTRFEKSLALYAKSLGSVKPNDRLSRSEKSLALYAKSLGFVKKSGVSVYDHIPNKTEKPDMSYTKDYINYPEYGSKVMPDEMSDGQTAKMVIDRYFHNINNLHIENRLVYKFTGYGWELMGDQSILNAIVYACVVDHIGSITANRANSIGKLIQYDVLTKIKQPKLLDQRYKVFSNGLFDAVKNKLVKHDRNHFYTESEYFFDADIDFTKSKYYKAMNVSFPNGKKTKQKYMQMLGYLMFAPKNYLEKVMVFEGASGAGKSLSLKVLNSLMGDRATPFSMDKINNPKIRINISKSVFAFDDDSHSPSKVDAGSFAAAFKSLTSCADMSEEQLYTQEMHNGSFSQTMAIAANKLPDFYDNSDAYIRRLEVIRYKVKISGGKHSNPNLLDDILNDDYESACAIAMIYQGYCDLFNHNNVPYGTFRGVKFVTLKASEKLIADEIISKRRGSLLDFADDNLRYKHGNFVSNDELFELIRDKEPAFRMKSNSTLGWMLKNSLLDDKFKGCEATILRKKGHTIRGRSNLAINRFVGV